jgi:hypothetical protein
MEVFLCNTVDNILRKVDPVNNKARRDCLTKILLGIIKSKPVQFPAIADEIKSKAKKSSIERRIQRFFKFFVFAFQACCFYPFCRSLN